MKKLNVISILFFLVLLWACNVFDSSEEGPIFKYQFQTDKMAYASMDTVNASFVNQSNQNIFLNPQGCTPAAMQKLEGGTWKPILIPVPCFLIYIVPTKVRPGEEVKISIALPIFEENELETGTYRLNVAASKKDGNQSKELTSNKFKITG